MERETEPDDYLLERIHDALVHDQRVGELDVHVAIAGKKVFLTGAVATDQRRRAVEEVVHELAPDHEVHNQTSVIRVSEPADVEELR